MNSHTRNHPERRPEASAAVFQKYPAKIVTSSPPTGNRMLDATKSIQSNTLFDPIVHSGSKPSDSTEGSPTIKTPSEIIHTARLRLHDRRSMKYFTGTSSKDTADVKAAIASRMKNNPPNRNPSGIAEKAAGRATKMSDGPWSGAIPNENVVGKMIRPAMNA
ncbi:hypothetical protein D3C74_401430 [compost metagenome]